MKISKSTNMQMRQKSDDRYDELFIAMIYRHLVKSNKHPKDWLLGHWTSHKDATY